MALPVVTQKSDPTGTNTLKFIWVFFEKLNSIFIGNQNICILMMTVYLASDKSDAILPCLSLHPFVFG